MPKNVFTTGTPGPNARIVVVALDADKKPLGNESTVAFTVLHTASPFDGFAVVRPGTTSGTIAVTVQGRTAISPRQFLVTGSEGRVTR